MLYVLAYFSINPYGGCVSMRTHASLAVVNKDSGFVKSAGLVDGATASVAGAGSSPSSSPGALAAPATGRDSPRTIASAIHPRLHGEHAATLAVCNDPRLPPYPVPLAIYAAFKIHV